eukprot:TRINITY_DN17808_c0_g4_i1.p1 TRINITY_DN17808_c0_g4~~TRINITY_DN17808_c0_g4_i1.p1  ORF type:complete len:487 (+),score=88.16 TRINITY_DN17808_c0_g4_i1:78-1463(+)
MAQAECDTEMPAPLGYCHRPELQQYCRAEPLTQEELAALMELLTRHGTLDTEKGKCLDASGKPTGMFSAASANTGGSHKESGYYASWIRDNCLVSYDLYFCDPHGAGGADAVACIGAIATFLLKYAYRFERVIGGLTDVKGGEEVWMERPHIRFDGSSLLEISDQKYNHKQNDALGYFIWMRCKLALDGKMPINGEHLKLLGQMFDYLRVIECWKDEDGGHWEEHSKIEASSLGPVLAGLRLFRRLVNDNGFLPPCKDDTLDLLEEKLVVALNEILPNECIQPGRERDVDAALIFLIYPLEVVDEHMAEKILDRVSKKITGPIGINRYAFDSFFCKDYKDLTGEDATKHFTDAELQERDKLVVHGEEAQWCIFDSMVSAYYGKLFLKHAQEKHFKMQQLYLSRSLAQISGDDCFFGPWHCPELYYLYKGKWQPDDQTPLLWAQGNLKAALHAMKLSLTKTT